ncbi:ABC transporter ATP-binding protein [Mycoplasmopsis maculosa]|uniref:ABC transporter ATP-binding protein n=1 Tax=Mycoplasmopsis maculosa TaxID=114885 RepID=A0A449B596_9BACT|nr:cysteine peptidase family C39 domain-containing protein [Mycoplasmopsis maculosa]VEU75698.1 ABC transporter ATP-binding protein [Mycoplasmopsis maculosa]
MKINKQIDIKDCAISILQYIIRKKQKINVDENYLKANVNYGENGINGTTLIHWADKFGIKIVGTNGDTNAFFSLDKKEFPIIVLINNNGLQHYVILEKIKGDFFYINDPANGKINKLKSKDFEKLFLNIAFFITEVSEMSKDKVFKLEDKINKLLPKKTDVYILLFIAVLNNFLIFGSTFFIKIVFEYIIPNLAKNTLFIVAFIFIWINLLRFTNQYIKNIIVKKITNKIELNIHNEFFKKISNSYHNQLSKINTVDFYKRLGFINQIANNQSNFAYSILNQIITIIVSFFLLIWINYKLFIIVSICTFFLLIINSIYQYYINNTYNKFVYSSIRKTKDEIDIINLRNQIYNTDIRDYLSYKLKNAFYDFKNNEYKFSNIQNNNLLINNLIIGNIGILIISISTIMIINNKFNSSDLMLFLTSSNFFTNPLLEISGIIMTRMLIKKHIHQLNYIFNFIEKDYKNGITINKIKNIKINNLSFQYELGKNIININEFFINKNIQLTGKNGSGKSTFCNILVGNIINFLGTYSINEVSFENINKEAFLNSCCYISTNDFIPNDNILNLISLNQNDYKKEFFNNIEKYNLGNLFSKFKININSEINDSGKNISNGQKQFINLLKLFIKKYKLIILDEAFESIDIENFNLIKEMIKKYQNEAFFVEISHSKKYIFEENEVNFEKINSCR